MPRRRTLLVWPATDDVLLASDTIQQLMHYIGNVNPEVVDPVIQRMLTSQDVEARKAGGQMAAFAALEWQRPQLDAIAKGTRDQRVRPVEGGLYDGLFGSALFIGVGAARSYAAYRSGKGNSLQSMGGSTAAENARTRRSRRSVHS